MQSFWIVKWYNGKTYLPVLMQSFWIVKWYNGKTYLLKQAGEDLVRVVSNKAVIGGPYAQALTIDNKLKSVTYMFGLSGKERGRFGRFPVTHRRYLQLAAGAKGFPDIERFL